MQSTIRKLEEDLNFESEANDRFNDINIDLKKQLEASGCRVVAHPSSLTRYEKRVTDLREALIIAVSMVPVTTSNHLQLESLKELYKKVI